MWDRFYLSDNSSIHTVYHSVQKWSDFKPAEVSRARQSRGDVLIVMKKHSILE